MFASDEDINRAMVKTMRYETETGGTRRAVAVDGLQEAVEAPLRLTAPRVEVEECEMFSGAFLVAQMQELWQKASVDEEVLLIMSKAMRDEPDDFEVRQLKGSKANAKEFEEQANIWLTTIDEHERTCAYVSPAEGVCARCAQPYCNAHHAKPRTWTWTRAGGRGTRI